MKKTDTDIINKAINTTGVITCTNGTEYQCEGTFNLISNSPDVISGISYTKPKCRIPTTLPCFIGIKPSYYTIDKVLHIIFLIGNEPCDLHRLIFCLDFSDAKQPVFTFIEDSIFGDCNCDDEPKIMTIAMSSGLGEGTWGP